MKHALDELREVSLKLHATRDEIYELEVQLHAKQREEARLLRLFELALDDVNRKAPA
jgi:hypothetical protein